MKTVKTLIIGLAAVALLASTSFAQEKKQTCCEKAAAVNKQCKNKCCLSAHKEGKSCQKCNPNQEDLKAMNKGKKAGK